MTEFDQFVTANKKLPLPAELRLVHSSRCEFFDAFEVSGQIAPRLCPVFKEDLVYLFYGRPAYRSTPAGVHEIGYCPICFILKDGIDGLSVRRVFPLDSGGVSNNRFTPHIKDTDLPDLELPNKAESGRAQAEVFFNKNEDYYLGEHDDTKSFAHGGSSLPQSFLNLQKSNSIVDSDDRRSVVEYQVDQSIDIANWVEAVVLPKKMLDDSSVRNTILSRWSAVPITYYTYRATCPSEYIVMVRELVMRFLKRKKLL